jgi:hypothetical protein
MFYNRTYFVLSGKTTEERITMKILKSCILIAVMLAAAAMVFSSCGKNGRPTSITVLPANPSIIPGTSQQFQAQGNLSDGVTYFLSVVNWSSSNTAVATIDPVSGLASAPSPTTTGTTTITAVNPYSGFTDSTTLTVSPLSSITVTPNLPGMTPGLTHQFVATGTLVTSATTTIAPTQDLTGFVSWTSSNPAVATVVSTPGIAGTGIVTSVATGTALIQASIVTLDTTGTTTVTVTGSTILTVSPVALTSLAIETIPTNPTSPPTISLAAGTLQFKATATFSDGSTKDWTPSVIWSSSNTAVATIDTTNVYGLATLVAPGVTTIAAVDPITGILMSTALTVTQ